MLGKKCFSACYGARMKAVYMPTPNKLGPRAHEHARPRSTQQKCSRWKKTKKTKKTTFLRSKQLFVTRIKVWDTAEVLFQLAVIL